MGTPSLNTALLRSSAHLAKALGAASFALLGASACSSAPPANGVPVATASASASASASEKAPKIEPKAEVHWKQRATPGQIPSVGHIATNAAGDVIFATETAEGAYLFRLDATSHLTWRTVLAGDRTVTGGVAIDSEGNAYVAGWFQTALALGGKLVSTGESSAFLIKLGTDGKKIWGNALRGDNASVPVLTLNAKGDLFLAGGHGGDMRVGAVSLRNERGEQPVGEGSLFVAQMTGSGSAKWARDVGAIGVAAEVALDGAGEMFVSGRHMTPGAPSFGPVRADRPHPSGVEHFLIKLDASGKPRWTRHIDASRMVAIPGGSGDVYACTGPFADGPSTLLRIAGDGRVVFKMPLPDLDKLMSCDDVAVDDEGRAYVVGMFYAGERDPMTGGEGVSPQVLKVDGTGNVVSTLRLHAGFTINAAPRLVWSKGRLLAAGVSGTYAEPSFFLAELTL